MFTLKLSQKVLLLFLAISIVPLVLLAAYWFRSEALILRGEAEARQQLLTEGAAERVGIFLDNKINTLIIHSQTSSVQLLEDEAARQELLAYMYQDRDLERVALVGPDGSERVVVEVGKDNPALADVSDSAPFRAATFLSGVEYVSPVFYDENGHPTVTVAVPLVTFATRQSLSGLTTSQPGLVRGNDDIKGVLIARIGLQNVWSSILSARLGEGGYAYLVDAQGRLIAHPDGEFMASAPDLSGVDEVAAFLRDPSASPAPSRTVSELGEDVISTRRPIERVGWALIAQEPVGSIYARAEALARTSTFVVLLSSLAVASVAFVFSRHLTRPIRKLAAGARQLSGGDFGARIDYTSADEFGTLAATFNSMAENVQTLVRKSEADRRRLNIVFNSVEEGLVALDERQTIVLCNTSASILVGRLPRELNGKRFEDVYDWQTEGGSRFELQHEQRSSLSKNVTLSRASGRPVLADILVNRVDDDPNGIALIITIKERSPAREQ